MQEFTTLAKSLADEAGEIIRKYYRQPFDIERKEDDSPVTIADRAVEQRLREIIETQRPHDGIIGEEYGEKCSENGLTWVIDPIDGTKSFMIGRPTFGTLIAVCEDENPILGVIDQPISQERWIGVKGQTTLFNGRPAQTRPCSTLAHASICSTTPAMFSETGPIYNAFETGSRMAWGGDCYMYGLLASGFLDITIEAALSPYDFAALSPIIEGAGGKICDFQGHNLTIKSDGCVVAMGDPKLWAEVSTYLK